MEKDVPIGWEEIELGDIADITAGIGFPKKHQGNSKGAIPFYKVGDISKTVVRGDQWMTSADHYIDESILKSLKGKLLPKGAIVFAKIGEALKLNRRAILSEPALVDNNVMAVIPYCSNMDKFIYYFLLTESLDKYSAGNAVPSVRKSSVLAIPFSLPSLPEQQRIVAKLDNLFGHHDSLKTRLNRIPQLLKDFRQKVLTQAVTGKLTEKWRKGKELKEWKMKMMGDFVIKIQAGKNFNCPEYPVTENTVGLVKISAVTWGKFNPNETKTVLDKSKIYPELFIKKGDFLMSRANTLELVGASLIVDEIKFRIMLSDKIWRVTFKEEIDKRYVDFFLKSSIGRNEIESRATGNQLSMRNISHDSFKKIDLNYPPIEEQQEIVRLVESLFAKADQIEASYKKLKVKIEQLPQALLAKAFRGELVEQLPIDGDARELLEEIRKAKAGLEKGGRTKKMKENDEVRMVAEDGARYGK